MFRTFFLSCWVVLLSLGSCYGVVYWLTSPEQVGTGAFTTGVVYENLRPFSVPVITEGQVTGYVVAQFVFVMDSSINTIGVPPQPYIIDEAFRRIYSDPDLDFAALDDVDLEMMLEDIRVAVNKRFEREIVEEILIEEFNFIPGASFVRAS